MLALLPSVPTICQVVWQNPYPTDDNLYSLFFSSANNGWAVGSAGEIVATNNGGLTWSHQESSTNSTLNDVQFISNSNGWAVGNGVILATVNGGLTWTVQKTIPGVSLQSICFIDPLHGWACGDGTILRTTSGGAAWTTVLSDSIDHFQSISFEDDNTGWAVGTGRVMKSTDGGLIWEDATASLQFPQARYQKVKFFGNSGWLVASMNWGVSVPNGDNLKGIVWRTTDGGTSWKQVYSDSVSYSFFYPRYFFVGETFLDESTGYVPATIGTIVTTDGGNTWSKDSSSPAGSYFMVDPNTIFGAGYLGYIDKSTDGGHTWQELSHGARDDLSRIRFFDDQTGIAAGGSYTESSFLRTTDGGNYWTSTTDMFTKNGVVITDFSFVTSTTGWLCGYWLYEGTGFSTNGGLVFKTTDGGYTWTEELNDSVYHRLFEISFIDSSNGIAAGEGEILRTTDGGATWTEQYRNLYGEPFLYGGVAWQDLNRQWVGGDDRLFYITDAGQNWQTITTLDGMQYYVIRRILFTSETTGWIVGSNVSTDTTSGFVLRTTDGGATWTNVLSGNTPEYDGIYSPDTSIAYIVGDSGTLVYTTDRGNTWKSFYLTHVNQNLSDIWVQDLQHAWIAGTGGTIVSIRSNITGISNGTIPAVPSDFRLFQNYPNPFNPSTIISYQLPVNSHVTLSIYDILGKEVATLVDGKENAGSYAVRFNGSYLASGVYFYRLQAENYSQTRKLVLVK